MLLQKELRTARASNQERDRIGARHNAEDWFRKEQERNRAGKGKRSYTRATRQVRWVQTPGARILKT